MKTPPAALQHRPTYNEKVVMHPWVIVPHEDDDTHYEISLVSTVIV